MGGDRAGAVKGRSGFGPGGGPLGAFLGSFSGLFFWLNPRKTRVFELPGVRKNVKIDPWGLVKYEVSARKNACSLDLAAFFTLKTEPNRAKTLIFEQNLVFYDTFRVFS